MAEGFKKCRKYFDMLDINGDRCAWGGREQRTAASPESAHTEQAATCCLNLLFENKQ
jgi:hypothetical protein